MSSDSTVPCRIRYVVSSLSQPLSTGLQKPVEESTSSHQNCQCVNATCCGLVVAHPSHVFNQLSSNGLRQIFESWVTHRHPNPPLGHLGWITSRARQQAVVEVLDVGIALDPGVEGLGMVRLE